MSKFKTFLLYLLILCTVTSPVLGAGYNYGYSDRDPSLIFSFSTKYHLLKDRVSGNALSTTYAGTNRTRINPSTGLMETIAANLPRIEADGLLSEGATANILIGNPPTTQDLTLPLGSYTLQVSGAGTAVSSAGTATITGAGTASDGTHNTFVVTVAGTVTITITTATVVWLTPDAFPSSYFAGAAAIGSELVTGFGAVTETNDYTSDFSAGVDGWSVSQGTVDGNIDTDADAVGQPPSDDWLRFTVNNASATHLFVAPAGTEVVGDCIRVRFKYYLPATNDNMTYMSLWNGAGSIKYIDTLNTTGAETEVDMYLNVQIAAGFRFYGNNGGVFQDAAGDDLFYIKDFIVDIVTFTNWTVVDGEGWAPQATAGALTGKAQKVAGTASDLTQTTTPAVAGTVYRLGHTAVRTAGTYTAEFGSTDGAAVALSGTYYDYVIAADTDYPKFKADASFAGSVAVATIKTHGTVRLSEASANTFTLPASVTAALADESALVVKLTTHYAEAQNSADAGFVSVKDAVASILYHDVSGNGFAAHDGTTEAVVAKAFTNGGTYVIVVRQPSSAGKYQIGVGDSGTWTWGTAVNFDGSFNPTGLIFGKSNEYPFSVETVHIYNKAKTTTFFESVYR